MQVKFYVCSLRLSLYFPKFCGIPETMPYWPSKLDALGLIFLVLESCVQEPEVGLRTLAPAGEPLQYDYSPVWGFPHSGCMGSNDIVILPLLPISLSFPPYVFNCRRSILVCSCLFHWCLLCRYLWFGVLMRGSKLRVFLQCHFGCSQKLFLT